MWRSRREGGRAGRRREGNTSCSRCRRRGGLQLGFGRGEFFGFAGGGEGAGFVAAVAEGFIFRLAAAAEGNDGAAGETVFAAFGVADDEIAFDAEGSVIDDGDFGRGHRFRW